METEASVKTINMCEMCFLLTDACYDEIIYLILK